MQTGSKAQDADQIVAVFDKVNEEMNKMALDDLPQDDNVGPSLIRIREVLRWSYGLSAGFQLGFRRG
jgi:hypothetical protein